MLLYQEPVQLNSKFYNKLHLIHVAAMLDNQHLTNRRVRHQCR